MSTVDVITMEVIGNALITVAQEMSLTLQRTAYSTIVRESLDCSAALFDDRGQLIAQAENIPSHLGSMGLTLKMLLKKYDWVKKLDPEDCIILNHPYLGGTHAPDITLFMPIYYKDKLFGFAGNIAHHVDVGGRAPGSMGNDVTDVYQEGLLIPPLKLLVKGEYNDSVVEMIKANVRDTVRLFGDLRAQIAANKTGARRTRQVIEKYGLDLVGSVCSQRMDYVEKLARKKIEAIPDGEYTAVGYMDDDGINKDRQVKIVVTVRVGGDRIVYDMAGTDPQTQGPINSVPGVSLSSAVYVTRCILEGDIPQNEGIFRVINLNIPEGCLLNPIHPAPCSARHQTMQRLCDIMLAALAKALPDEIPAGSNAHATAVTCGGIHPDSGKYFVYFELNGGGFGARCNKDGMDGVDVNLGNCMNVPVEAAELEYPLLFERYELIQGSGGAGKFRGGLGFRRDIRVLTPELTFTLRSDAETVPPQGLYGGKEGTPGRKYLIRTATGEEIRLYRKATHIVVREGEILSIRTPGSGGYGNPLERDPRMVVNDILDEKISIASAIEDYGVKFDPGDRTFQPAGGRSARE